MVNPIGNPQSAINSQRVFIESLSQEFSRLHRQWCALIEACPADILYHQLPGPRDGIWFDSVAATVLRSAAVVEQTFGGITANLWDDPFEWTLPETLSSTESILEYLGEVQTTRNRAFDSLQSDSDLLRDIAMPSGELQNLASLLLETLTRARELHGQAILTAKILSVANSSRFII